MFCPNQTKNTDGSTDQKVAYVKQLDEIAHSREAKYSKGRREMQRQYMEFHDRESWKRDAQQNLIDQAKEFVELVEGELHILFNLDVKPNVSEKASLDQHQIDPFVRKSLAACTESLYAMFRVWLYDVSEKPVAKEDLEEIKYKQAQVAIETSKKLQHIHAESVEKSKKVSQLFRHLKAAYFKEIVQARQRVQDLSHKLKERHVHVELDDIQFFDMTTFVLEDDSSAEAQVEKLTLEIQSLQTHNGTLEESLAQIRQNNADLVAKLTKAEKVADGEKAAEKRQKNAERAAEAQMDKLKQDMLQIAKERDETQYMLQDLQGQLDQLSSAKLSLEDENSKLVATVEDLTDQLKQTEDRMDDQLAEAELRCRESENELKELRENPTQVEKEVVVEKVVTIEKDKVPCFDANTQTDVSGDVKPGSSQGSRKNSLGVVNMNLGGGDFIDAREKMLREREKAIEEREAAVQDKDVMLAKLKAMQTKESLESEKIFKIVSKIYVFRTYFISNRKFSFSQVGGGCVEPASGGEIGGGN